MTGEEAFLESIKKFMVGGHTMRYGSKNGRLYLTRDIRYDNDRDGEIELFEYNEFDGTEDNFEIVIRLPKSSITSWRPDEVLRECINRASVTRTFLYYWDRNIVRFPDSKIFGVNKKVAEIPGLIEIYKGAFTGVIPQFLGGDVYAGTTIGRKFRSYWDHKPFIEGVDIFKAECDDLCSFWCINDSRYTEEHYDKSMLTLAFANRWLWLFVLTQQKIHCTELRRQIGEGCIVIYNGFNWFVVTRYNNEDFLISFHNDEGYDIISVIQALYDFFNLDPSDFHVALNEKTMSEMQYLTYL